jgi:TRAP-type uncharacterized transport system substrate-binding protein
LTVLDQALEVKILAAGANWLRVGSMIGLGLTGYSSPLPAGSTVSVHTMHPGESCLAGLRMVDAGQYHFGMTSPPWVARMAAEGRGAFGFGETPLQLSGVCVLPHFDQLAFAVRRDVGVSSLRELKERKVPLRISTGPIHTGHPVGWVIDAVLAEYGIAIEDFERWGGQVTYADRQLNFIEEGPADRKDRVASIRSGDLDAVFDEGLMSKTWKDITDTVDVNFLPVDRDVLASLEKKYGMRPSKIPKGRFRGQNADVDTVDFAGWLLYCRRDLPDRLVYLALAALEEQRPQIESLFEGQRPFQGLSDLPFDMATIWRGTELPLHPGAEAFYRERGYKQ